MLTVAGVPDLLIAVGVAEPVDLLLRRRPAVLVGNVVVDGGLRERIVHGELPGGVEGLKVLLQEIRTHVFKTHDPVPVCHCPWRSGNLVVCEVRLPLHDCLLEGLKGRLLRVHQSSILLSQVPWALALSLVAELPEYLHTPFRPAGHDCAMREARGVRLQVLVELRLELVPEHLAVDVKPFEDGHLDVLGDRLVADLLEVDGVEKLRPSWVPACEERSQLLEPVPPLGHVSRVLHRRFDVLLVQVDEVHVGLVELLAIRCRELHGVRVRIEDVAGRLGVRLGVLERVVLRGEVGDLVVHQLHLLLHLLDELDHFLVIDLVGVDFNHRSARL